MSAIDDVNQLSRVGAVKALQNLKTAQQQIDAIEKELKVIEMADGVPDVSIPGTCSVDLAEVVCTVKRLGSLAGELFTHN